MRPAITFGIIVLNGEPFLRYNLRAIYPFASQIIVVEGASPLATHMATSDGHSIDGTLETLRRFQAEEDPERKLVIVTAEDEGHPNGFWPGEKDEQSQAYAKRATGEWLWQIDIDEFYQPDVMQLVCDALARHPETTCITFQAHHFWGGFDYEVLGGLFLNWDFQGEPWGAYRRVFRWRPGYRYVTHRPPTVADETGQNITRASLLRAERLSPGRAVRMYHYLMVFPAQFTRKGAYYERQLWAADRGRLRKNEERLRAVDLSNGLRIYDHYGTHNWLARFAGAHPPMIDRLRADIAAGRVAVELRHTDDIERLLASPRYRLLCTLTGVLERGRAHADHLLILALHWPRRLVRAVRRAVAPADPAMRLR